jgi:hypothetical protein
MIRKGLKEMQNPFSSAVYALCNLLEEDMHSCRDSIGTDDIICIGAKCTEKGYNT